MIIAHIPFGYLFTKIIYIKIRKKLFGLNKSVFYFFALLGSILPDIDMLFFYFIDNKKFHHHTYLTHFPATWLILLLTSLLLISKHRQAYYLLILTLNASAHMVLDSFVGIIYWLAPLSYQPFSILGDPVTARFNLWWLNFIFHWTFIVEILIAALATYVFLYSRQQKIRQNRARTAFYIAT